MEKGEDLRMVGRAVAARRGELGMTQQDLADAAGVDLKTVYNLESGTRWPIARTRVAIAAALRWNADALAAIADGSAPARLPAPAPRALPEPPPGFPPATPEMAEDMADYWAEIQAAMARARRHHPGVPLTGSMVYPMAPDSAARWDRLAAEFGGSEAGTAWMLAAWRAWDAQERADAGRNRHAAGLILA